MGSKGSQTSTVNTQSNQTYTPTGAPYLTSALGAAAVLANKGTPNIPTAPVAGFSGQQQQAFGLAGNTGIQNPYLQQAQNYFSPQGTQAFANPYINNVTAQLQNIFGQQNQQNNANLVQAAGGVGADRIAVGQGNLANQQALAAGQTYANLYGQAAQQAQSAAYGTAGLGAQAQQANTQDINTLLGAGGLQQQLAQAQLNAPYQQQLAQMALPYQLSQWYSGQIGSLAPALGGTSQGAGTNNTVSQYNPSLFSQILGTAGTAAGLFGKGSGGSVPYARGGEVNPFGFDDGGVAPIDVSRGIFSRSLVHLPDQSLPPAQTHVPNLNLNLSPANMPNMSQQEQQDMKAAMGLGKNLRNLTGPSWGGGSILSDAWGGSSNNPLSGLTASDYGAGYARGGVNPYRMPHFDDGGSTDGGEGGGVSDPGAAANMGVADYGAPGTGGFGGVGEGAGGIGEGTGVGATTDPGNFGNIGYGYSNPASAGFAMGAGADTPAATAAATGLASGIGLGEVGANSTMDSFAPDTMTGPLGFDSVNYGLGVDNASPTTAMQDAAGRFGVAFGIDPNSIASQIGVTNAIVGPDFASLDAGGKNQSQVAQAPNPAMTAQNFNTPVSFTNPMAPVAVAEALAPPPAVDIGQEHSMFAPVPTQVANTPPLAMPAFPATVAPQTAQATPDEPGLSTSFAPAEPTAPQATPAAPAPSPSTTPAEVAAALGDVGGISGGQLPPAAQAPNVRQYGYAPAIPVGYTPAPTPAPFVVPIPRFDRGGIANPYRMHFQDAGAVPDDTMFELGNVDTDEPAPVDQSYRRLANLGLQRGQIDAAAQQAGPAVAAAQESAAARASLPGAIGQLESSGRGFNGPRGRYANELYQQFPAFVKQYGAGEAGIKNYAQQVLKAKPDATFGDLYGGYVTGTGNPGAARMESLLTTTQPGARGAYANLLKNSPIDPRTPLASLMGGNAGNTEAYSPANDTLTRIAQNGASPLSAAVRQAPPDAPGTQSLSLSPAGTGQSGNLPQAAASPPYDPANFAKDAAAMEAAKQPPKPFPSIPYDDKNPYDPETFKLTAQTEAAGLLNPVPMPEPRMGEAGPPLDITPQGQTAPAPEADKAGFHLFGKNGYISNILHDPARVALISAGLSAFTPAGFAGGFQKGMELMHGQETIDQAAKKLDEEANYHQKTIERFTEANKIAARKEAFEEQKPFVLGKNLYAQPIYGVLKDGQYVQPGSNKPIDLSQIGEMDEQQMEAVAQNIAAYKSQPISAYKQTTPIGIAIQKRVQELNPQYDAKFYKEAQDTRDKFAVGQQGDSVRSVGTSFRHLDLVEKALDAMDNGTWKTANALRNAFKTEFGLSSAPTQFDAIKDIAMDEVTKAVIGARGALGDRESNQAKVSKSLAPGILRDVLRDTYKPAMLDQLQGFKQQYVAGTHGATDFNEKLSPEVADALEAKEKQDKAEREAKKAAPAEGKAAGVQAPAGRPDVRTRFKELIKSGVSETDAYNKLHEEGYQ